jgi:flagellar hook-basal body complex protein FliE
MPISPIGAIRIPDLGAITPTAPTGPSRVADTVGTGDDIAGGFGNMLTDSLQSSSAAQRQTDALTTQAVTGEATDLTAVMASMTEAQLSTQLTVALRNKAVESFNEIMRMQL